MENHQIKFVYIDDLGLSSQTYDGRIEISPELRWRLEHENPLDPIEIDKIDRYHEDEIRVDLILTTDDYNELYDLLENQDTLYIEFQVGDFIRQYEVSEFEFPVLKDEGRIYKFETDMKIISRYRGSLPASFDSRRFTLNNVIFL